MNLKNKLDKKKRLNFVKFEEKYNIIKSIKNGEKLKTGLKWIFTSKFNKKMWKNSKTQINNRCVLSGRARSIYKFARLSRLFLRENEYINLLPGLQKSYW